MDSDRENAILRLLDDPSTVVRKALLSEFKKQTAESISFLKRVVRLEDKSLSSAARKWLDEVGGEDTVAQFLSFINEYNYELEAGIILLERVMYPEFDMKKYYDYMEEISNRCKELIVSGTSGMEKCKVLNRVLFHEYSFRGDVETYFSPLNSYLHQVLTRKKGIPITLSILYMLIAQRCNIHLEPIGFPGRFMVGCFADEKPFYIDAYANGKFRSVEEIEELFKDGKMKLEHHHLMPTNTGEVLSRICRNLINQYVSEKEFGKAHIFSLFVQAFEEARKKNVGE